MTLAIRRADWELWLLLSLRLSLDKRGNFAKAFTGSYTLCHWCCEADRFPSGPLNRPPYHTHIPLDVEASHPPKTQSSSCTSRQQNPNSPLLPNRLDCCDCQFTAPDAAIFHILPSHSARPQLSIAPRVDWTHFSNRGLDASFLRRHHKPNEGNKGKKGLKLSIKRV